MSAGNIAGYLLVKGQCPRGCGDTLFLGDGGYVTCSLLRCPEPDAATRVLEARSLAAEGGSKPDPLREGLQRLIGQSREPNGGGIILADEVETLLSGQATEGQRESDAKIQPHGEIQVRDHDGYSVYVCGDCGQNINTPHCPARATFDTILRDPTQQLDAGGVVAASVLGQATEGQQDGTQSAEEEMPCSMCGGYGWFYPDITLSGRRCSCRVKP